jgi:hypothetical protein
LKNVVRTAYDKQKKNYYKFFKKKIERLISKQTLTNMAATQTNAWQMHLRQFRAMNPHVPPQMVFKMASKTYNSPYTFSKRPVAKKTKRRSTPRKGSKPIKYYPNGRPYNYGRSWHMDRYMHNKNEPWEVPRNKRKLPVWN